MLADSLIRAARDPGVVEPFGALGFEVRARGSQRLADLLTSETSRWREVIRAANITEQWSDGNHYVGGILAC